MVDGHIEDLPVNYSKEGLQARHIVRKEKENKRFVNITKSDEEKNIVAVLANESSSMASGSVSMEIDIVEIYKRKINTNSKLQKRRLMIINAVFILALCIYIILVCASCFAFK